MEKLRKFYIIIFYAKFYYVADIFFWVINKLVKHFVKNLDMTRKCQLVYTTNGLKYNAKTW